MNHHVQTLPDCDCEFYDAALKLHAVVLKRRAANAKQLADNQNKKKEIGAVGIEPTTQAL